ncbi:MAG: topoisomerase DNA-binding C4 zinc finger domain-containing protein [Lachnospiraceae bacterium]|nr:topoisomerase DNA-binding C4 zinc finger domain-containing protein [Lachnospiraceae bacterium]
MLGKTKGTHRNEYLPDHVVFDLETTGISCRTDRVVEISAIKVIGGQITDEFSSLVNPECPIPYRASMVNGITDDMVADAPLFPEVLDDFLTFIGDMVLVGHNIQSFDLNFLNRDCEALYGKVLMNDYVDTLKLSRLCLPGQRHHTLEDLASLYGISTQGAHRALNDCRMNAAVYQKLGEVLEESLKNAKKCPRCGSVLTLRTGRFGRFMGCSAYPACRYTENV